MTAPGARGCAPGDGEVRAPLAREAIRTGYDRAAAGYDRAHAEPRTLARDRAIDRPQLAAAAGARRVLELGCGTGRLLGRCAAPLRIGIDLSPAMLAVAHGRGIAVAVADAHRLPLADAGFDAILAGKGVFRYLDPPAALAECARVLAPGGQLAVHQYSARTWGPRRAWRRWRQRLSRAPRAGADPGALRRAAGAGSRAAPPDAEDLHVRDLRQLTTPAGAAGLALRSVHLFRSLPVYPYVVRVPAWAPAALWSQCVIVFERRPA